jgi:DNA-binding HxlR family transcriptional regulator
LKESKSTRRSYRQYCGVARALDVVGERWTLLIVRNLLIGPRRYSDLLRELPGITTNLLAKRLAEMEDAELVERRSDAAVVYALTPTGEALEPVVMELGRFGGRYMDKPKRTDRVDLGWALLSSKRRYHGGLDCVVDVRSDDGRRFELRFADVLCVQERAAARADAIVRGRSEDLRVAFAHPDRAIATEAARALTVEGDAATWRAAFRALAR